MIYFVTMYKVRKNTYSFIMRAQRVFLIFYSCKSSSNLLTHCGSSSRGLKRQKYIGRHLLFFLTRWYVSKLHIRFKTKAWILNLDQRYVSIPQHFFCKNFQNGGYNFVGESRACQDFDAKGFISIVEKFVVYVADFFDTLSVMKGW